MSFLTDNTASMHRLVEETNDDCVESFRMMLYGKQYSFGDGLIEALVASLSHISTLHLAKNITLLVLAVAVIHRYDHLHRSYLVGFVITLLTGPLLAGVLFPNYLGFAGSSGGTFFLLAVALFVARRRHLGLVAVVATVMVLHQVVTWSPANLVHTIVFSAGLYTAWRTS